MATMTLKGVPEQLLAQLKREARQSRRSLNQEVLARLEASLLAPRRDKPSPVKALRGVHKRLARLPRLTDAFLERARKRGPVVKGDQGDRS